MTALLISRGDEDTEEEDKKIQGEDKPRREASKGTSCAGTLILGFPTFRTLRRLCENGFLCLGHPVSGALLENPYSC